MPWASKTPFGIERTKTNPAVSLIQTPSGMAEFQRHDISLVHGYHLSKILRHVSYLTGDQSLVDDYKARIIQELKTFDEQDKTTNTNRFAHVSLNRTMKENEHQDVTNKLVDVKKGMYRFPTIAVVNLGLLCGVYSPSAWDIIQEMEKAGIVTEENAHHLQVLVSISGELRLRTYLELGSQKENLSGLLAMRKQQGEDDETLLKSAFYVPDQKMLFRYYYTERLLKHYVFEIAMGSASEVIARIRQWILYDASSRVKADISKELLQFKAAIAHIEDVLTDLEDGEDAISILYGTIGKLYQKAHLLGQQAKCYSRLGDHRMSISCWEEQLKVQQQLQIHGHDDKLTEISRTYCNLGRAWVRLGDREKTVTYYKQAMAFLNKGSVDLEVAAAPLDKIGSLNDHEKALITSNIETLLNTWKTILGENSAHPYIAFGLQAQGEWLNSIGDYTKAITYNEESLKITKIRYGQDTAHPDIAAALTNLGISLCKGRNDHVKALRCHEDALEMYKVIYGNDEPNSNIAKSLDNIGTEWWHLGDNKKAISYCEQALQMLKLVGGGDKVCPDIARILSNLGHLWYIVEDYDKALAFAEQALKMNQQLHAPNSHHNAISLMNIGSVLEESGENIKAINYYKEALTMMEVVLDKEHPDIALVLGILGSAFHKTGKKTESLEYCERALGVIERIRVENAVTNTVAKSLRIVATVYEDLGDCTKALHLYEDALNIVKAIHDTNASPHFETHPQLLKLLNKLETVCNKVGDQEKARSYHDQTRALTNGTEEEETPRDDTESTDHKE